MFEQVEVKPQALEWIFSQATGVKFDVSFDNLDGAPGNKEKFKQAVQAQMHYYQKHGLPARAHIFHQALLGYY